jgi:Putative DNA-binding domain
MFPTRLSEVTAAQIQEIITTETPESIEFELKKALSTKGGVADAWMSGGKIGDRAKDELTIEIVAFANTSGGTLIVGVDEDPQTKSAIPPICPTPRCKEAAAVLHQSLSACIEPRVPVFECEGVVTEPDGTSGVIVMRVLESYLAPHRNTKDNSSYTRRNDRAEPMSMLEIQELTRRVARSSELVERAFSESSDSFFDWLPTDIKRTHPRRGIQGVHFEEQGKKFYTGFWAVRITAVPLRPLSLGKLPGRSWLEDLKVETFNGPGRQGMLRPYDVDVIRQWIPRLRAVQREFKGDWLLGLDRIASDGQLDRFVLVRNTVEGGGLRSLHLGMREVIWNVASVVRLVDIIRARASRPTQDFALEIEFGCSDPLHMDPYAGLVPSGLRKLPAGQTIFPRYEIGSRDGFNELLTTVDGDFWNLGGNHPDWQPLDWPLAPGDS